MTKPPERQMPCGFLDIAATPDLPAAQGAMSGDYLRHGFGGHREFDRFADKEVAFIGVRDSFYMATVPETAGPYIQYRGRLPGFLKLIGKRALTFADYPENQKYIGVGNLKGEDRVCLFLIDYGRRARMKVYAHVEMVTLEAAPEMTARVVDPCDKAPHERLFRSD